MIYIKTWEMIKALTENPKLRFKTGLNSFVQVNKEDGSIIWTNKDGSNVGSLVDRFILYSNGPCYDNLHIDWELVREPVPWQEALQAWIDGKEVIREMTGTSCIFSKNNSFTVGRIELIEGKWFIK